MENQAECCPRFDPAPWDGQIHTWENKPFIRDHVKTLFFIPLNFGQAMRRVDKKIRAAGATVPGNMGLSDHTSPWNMNIYVAVDKEIPGAENVAFSGKYYSRVYEGSYQNTGKWMKDFSAGLKTKGLSAEKTYTWYTTCPKCAKKYGKNYVVVLGQVH